MPDVSEPSAGRVLVLGGQGVLGTAIAGAFGAAGWTSVRAGRRPDPGADFRLGRPGRARHPRAGG